MMMILMLASKKEYGICGFSCIFGVPSTQLVLDFGNIYLHNLKILTINHIRSKRRSVLCPYGGKERFRHNSIAFCLHSSASVSGGVGVPPPPLIIP